VRILFACSNVPSPGHTVGGAVTMVSFEAARAFHEAGHDVAVQPILDGSRGSGLTPAEQDDIAAIERTGLQVLDPLWGQHWGRGAGRATIIRQALRPRIEEFYPTLSLAPEVRRRSSDLGADLVFHVWSPESLAACSLTEAPVFAYQGNPDHLPTEARLRHPALFDIPCTTVRQRAAIALRRVGTANWRREHLRLMETCRWTANNSALDAAFYTRHGHPRSFYVQNMWADLYPDTWHERREAARPAAPDAIIGSIGNLRTTGNTFGLRFLGEEIVPALQRLRGTSFRMDVLGPGAPHTAVEKALAHPLIERRGFVDDIDEEIFGSEIFLLANNCCEDFRVGHTRILHAWTLGACLVAHRNIALAMPEVVHGENALLGETADEIAAHLATVLEDRALRRRLGDAGRRTYEQVFRPRDVIARTLEIVAP
jgi:glycosyltransferase involved in cell wall biosynthesis